MCVQVNTLYACRHRCFKRFENCPHFGQSCFGAGSNHRDEAAGHACKDCRSRELQGHVGGQGDASSSEGGTPDSGSSGGSGGGGERKADPWWDGDPWRRYRKG